MIDMIAKLIDTGHAYAAGGGHVYFDARSFPGYGELSGNSLSQLRPGHRSGGATDPRKRFHADWALWKGAPEGRELTWPAPWGTGFPGWHTECSAMSLHYLGDVIDIHTGGIDLRFPHHEDERAQSDSVPATRSSGTGCTASTCCSRAARWPNRRGTSCWSPISPRAASTRWRPGWPSSSTTTGSS